MTDLPPLPSCLRGPGASLRWVAPPAGAAVLTGEPEESLGAAPSSVDRPALSRLW